MRYIITKEHNGLLLRTFLQRQLLLSHAELSRLKSKENGITVNGAHKTVRYTLAEGDVLELDASDGEGSDISPQRMHLSVLYEDEHIIAVDKPSGMPTHPSHGHYTDTLANGLAYYFQQKGELSVFRAVTRLDKDTSGIVLCAKNAISCAQMSCDMQNGSFKKGYFAVTHGIFPEKGTLNARIRRKEESVILRCVCGEGEGKHAVTEYERISCKSNTSFVSLTPITGRTHQLRVHCSHIGHPILGDVLYGDCNAERLMLHAGYLSFPHPVTKNTVVIESPLPNGFLTYV